MMPWLELKDIGKSFSGVQALRNVDLSIAEGEIRCLVGENGSGKSTLIKLVAGVIRPDSGVVSIRGRQYRALRPIDAIKEGIQVIYQDFSLFPNLTVAENIALNSLLYSRRRLINWREVREIAQKAVENIGFGLPLEERVENLPVASKQLVAIARALVQDARLVIMDEPTTALTQKEVDRLLSIILNFKSRGVSTLFVTHKLDEVMAVSDRISILRNGSVVADETAAKFDVGRLTYFMTGREIRETRYDFVPQSDREPVLQLLGLTRNGAFADISLDIEAGEIVGVTGLLGCGRTELALSLFGMLPADKGRVVVNGKEASIKSASDAVANGIAYVPEDRLTEGLFFPLSLSTNMATSVIDGMTRWGCFSMRALRRFGSQWLEKLKIAAPSAETPVKNLSGGNQQRVVLARCLATSPKILILNGPTVGVDVGSKAEIHAIVRSLAKQGVAVLVISDDIPELLHMCNRIFLMRDGRLVQEMDGATDERELIEKLAG